MIYRKALSQPTRLLLRAVAGAGALVALAGCSSASSGGGTPGVAVNPEAGDEGGPCGIGVCGSVPLEAGGGIMGVVDAIAPDDANPLDGHVGVVPLDGGADQ